MKPEVQERISALIESEIRKSGDDKVLHWSASRLLMLGLDDSSIEFQDGTSLSISSKMIGGLIISLLAAKVGIVKELKDKYGVADSTFEDFEKHPAVVKMSQAVKCLAELDYILKSNGMNDSVHLPDLLADLAGVAQGLLFYSIRNMHFETRVN
jgi:hypothetical protein